MNDTEFHRALNPGQGTSFGDTNWWVVHEAGQPELPQTDAARASLCRTYWYPVYCYVRGLGQGREDAQDLTQEFFARLLERNYVQAAARDKGKFRTYLLTMLKRFLADQWDRAHRQKRGGGPQRSRLMRLTPSSSAETNRPMKLTPDKLFDRAWAQTLLAQALERLEQECAAGGREKIFQELKPFVICDSEVTCSATAERLGMSVSNLKVSAHRLRQRFRELVRTELAKTAASLDEVEAELRDLYTALR